MARWRQALLTVGHNDYVLDVLDKWEKSYGPIDVKRVSSSGFQVEFSKLPGELDELAGEINALCPDIISQGYSSVPDTVKEYKESGRPMPAKLAELVEGVDFGDKGFGNELLKRDLKRRRAVTLWWD